MLFLPTQEVSFPRYPQRPERSQRLSFLLRFNGICRHYLLIFIGCVVICSESTSGSIPVTRYRDPVNRTTGNDLQITCLKPPKKKIGQIISFLSFSKHLLYMQPELGSLRKAKMKREILFSEAHRDLTRLHDFQ